MIKTEPAGFCKKVLQDKLKGCTIPREVHVAAVTALDGVKMIEVSYRAEYDNGKKAKAKKFNFLSYFWRQTVSPQSQVFNQIRN